MSENENPQENANSEPIATESISELTALKEQLEKYKNDYLYLRADFDNYKKHSIRERSDYLKYGSERLVLEMLGILDNFERALETKVSNESLATFVKGIELTAQEFKSALQKFGVAEVDSEGKVFDPSLHEALSAEVSDKFPAGHVLRVFKKPYKLHDKLIRPGQVVVSKSPAKE